MDRISTVSIFFGFVFSGILCGAPYGGGSGSSTDPYQIRNMNHIDEMRLRTADWGSHFKLMADIDLAGRTFTSAVVAPDSDSSEYGFQGTAFTGVFDGSGKRIRNFAIDTLGDSDQSNDGACYLGFFGNCSQAIIKNLHLENVRILSGDSRYVGGLCGLNEGGIISRCSVVGSIESGQYSWCTGGLTGKSEWLYSGDGNFVVADVDRCYCGGSVTGGYDVGGLIGKNAVSRTFRSFSNSQVSGQDYVGGFIGTHYGHVPVADCYAAGDVSGSTWVGGFIGQSYSVNDDEGILNCYARGRVQSPGLAGGFIGYAENDGITHDCFFDTQACGTGRGVGNQDDPAGTAGKTTQEMMTASTFTDAGWDFDAPLWMTCGANYPRLVWNSPDINGDGRVQMADLARLARNWLGGSCGFCDNADLTGDQKIDYHDLLVYSQSWLSKRILSDDVLSIEIATALDYGSPATADDDTFDFEFCAITGDAIEAIEFTSPAGKTFLIIAQEREVSDENGSLYVGRDTAEEEDGWEWGYEAEFSDAGGLADFGDGEYLVRFYYANGRIEQLSVPYSVPASGSAIGQPTQRPLFTSFAEGDTVSSPVTVSWQPCTDANVNMVWLGYENNATSEEEDFMLPANASQLAAPLNLEQGEHEFELGFENWFIHDINGITIYTGKYSESDYTITVE